MNSQTTYARVTPADVRQRVEHSDSVILVDVRSPGEYVRRHIPGVLLMPIDELAARVGELDPDDEIICLCEHGVRSEMTAQYLAALGFPRVATMTGGMAQYTGAVETEK